MIEFAAQSPPEPAVGSVVLDLDDVAWQRVGQGGTSFWCPARPMILLLHVNSLSWPHLLVEKRTLRLVYDAAQNVERTVKIPAVPVASGDHAG